MVGRCVTWVDKHPRLGWYIATVVTLEGAIQVAGTIFHAFN